MSSSRVVVFGDLNLDIVYFLDSEEISFRDVSYVARSASYFPGGVAGNFSVATRRLGLPPTPIATVGSDPVADMLLGNLVEEGVDTRFVNRVSGEPTGVMSIVVGPSGRRVILGYRGANALNIVDEQRVVESLRVARYLLSYGFVVYNVDSGHSLLELIRVADREGIEVGVDVGGIDRSRAGILPQIRGRVSHVFVNVDELSDILGYSGVDAAEALYRSLKPRTLFLKMGSRGAIAFVGDKKIHRPSFKIRATDTTGCGDAFNAGVVYALIRGYDINDALLIGNAMGAFKAQGLGPKYLPKSIRELEEFIELYIKDLSTSQTSSKG